MRKGELDRVTFPSAPQKWCPNKPWQGQRTKPTPTYSLSSQAERSCSKYKKWTLKLPSDHLFPGARRAAHRRCLHRAASPPASGACAGLFCPPAETQKPLPGGVRRLRGGQFKPTNADPWGGDAILQVSPGESPGEKSLLQTSLLSHERAYGGVGGCLGGAGGTRGCIWAGRSGVRLIGPLRPPHPLPVGLAPREGAKGLSRSDAAAEAPVDRSPLHRMHDVRAPIRRCILGHSHSASLDKSSSRPRTLTMQTSLLPSPPF